MSTSSVSSSGSTSAPPTTEDTAQNATNAYASVGANQKKEGGSKKLSQEESTTGVYIEATEEAEETEEASATKETKATKATESLVSVDETVKKTESSGIRFGSDPTGLTEVLPQPEFMSSETYAQHLGDISDTLVNLPSLLVSEAFVKMGSEITKKVEELQKKDKKTSSSQGSGSEEVSSSSSEETSTVSATSGGVTTTSTTTTDASGNTTTSTTTTTESSDDGGDPMDGFWSDLFGKIGALMDDVNETASAQLDAAMDATTLAADLGFEAADKMRAAADDTMVSAFVMLGVGVGSAAASAGMSAYAAKPTPTTAATAKATTASSKAAASATTAADSATAANKSTATQADIKKAQTDLNQANADAAALEASLQDPNISSDVKLAGENTLAHTKNANAQSQVALDEANGVPPTSPQGQKNIATAAQTKVDAAQADVNSAEVASVKANKANAEGSSTSKTELEAKEAKAEVKKAETALTDAKKAQSNAAAGAAQADGENTSTVNDLDTQSNSEAAQAAQTEASKATPNGEKTPAEQAQDSAKKTVAANQAYASDPTTLKAQQEVFSNKHIYAQIGSQMINTAAQFSRAPTDMMAEYAKADSAELQAAASTEQSTASTMNAGVEQTLQLGTDYRSTMASIRGAMSEVVSATKA